METLKLLTSPLTPVYDLAKIKTYLRVLDDHQNAQIEMMANAYLLKAEEITNLILQGISTFEWSIDGSFRDLVLPKNPVTEIVEVEYIDNAEEKQTLPLAQVEYSFPLGATKTPFTLFFTGDLPNAKKIILTFKAGFESMDSRVEMYLNAKIAEEYDNLPDNERSKYTDRMLDSLRVNYL